MDQNEYLAGVTVDPSDVLTTGTITGTSKNASTVGYHPTINSQTGAISMGNGSVSTSSILTAGLQSVNIYSGKINVSPSISYGWLDSFDGSVFPWTSGSGVKTKIDYIIYGKKHLTFYVIDDAALDTITPRQMINFCKFLCLVNLHAAGMHQDTSMLKIVSIDWLATAKSLGIENFLRATDWDKFAFMNDTIYYFLMSD